MEKSGARHNWRPRLHFDIVSKTRLAAGIATPSAKRGSESFATTEKKYS